MLTGELRSQIDRIWDAFWTGGISNPLEVIEQITYLLFIKRLDELQTNKEKKANRLKREIEDPIFNTRQKALRWSTFKNMEPGEMYRIVSEKVFPFIKDLKSDTEDSSYTRHMKDARFMIPTPALLAKVVDMIDRVPMDDRDTKGDVYEYLLAKLTTAKIAGQFRTPRHIIKMMVELVRPKPDDIICDPACGTAGFLVGAAQYLQEHHGEMFFDKKKLQHFNTGMFHGFDFDFTMLRIGSMNMLLHGVENPDISYKDSLSEENAFDAEQYTLILANPPFKGALDYESTARDLLQLVKTNKTVLLFLALFIRLLKPGGRAAVIVPDGVVFGNSRAHKSIKRELLIGQKLEAVISMPSGVFKPYAGVSTAILLFTKTNSGGSDWIWFYDMEAEGFSLDDKRTPLDSIHHENNNIPDVLTRFSNLPLEHDRSRSEQSFFVSKGEIEGNDYDLSIRRYRLKEQEQHEHPSPISILHALNTLEESIQMDLFELQNLLSA
jgi:type I restriction enzyme M protein